MPALPLQNEQEILHAIAKGDQQAFGQLYDHYRKKVYFIAWRLLQSESEAEDVQQEIFTKLWTGRTKLGAIAHFNAYLNSMIRNHVFTALRRKELQLSYVRETIKTAEEDPDTEAAFRVAEINELQGMLQDAIRLLPPQQKKVFHLIRMEGRSHAEVAGLMGISKETVKKHLAEAKRFISTYFEGKGKTLLLLVLLLLTLN